MRDRSQPFRVAARLALIGTVTACPQLLPDGFELDASTVQLPGDSDGAITDGHEPDASVASPTGGGSNGGASGSASTLPSAGGAGGSGSGGSAGTSANAGSAGDAGTTSPPDANQVALHAALVHRYRFDTDAPLVDSLGGPGAAAVGGATFSNGAAVLAGTSPGQYIDLPNGLLSGLRNASFEVWVTWDVSSATSSSSEWQRIFDLGRNPSNVESQQCAVDVSGTDLYLTPSNEYGKMQLECESCTGSTLTTSDSLPLGVAVQVVAVVDDDANTLSLYQNGGFVTSVPFSGSLSQITNCTGHATPCDWNNWLGRSQHIEDPPFAGKILDFRVYSAALGPNPIKASFDGGPDADW